MITAYSMAKKWIGLKEVKGLVDNPMIMQFLTLDHSWPQHDEVPWCSGFLNWICWQADLPRSKNLLARSWLGVGSRIRIDDAAQGFDIVVLKRGSGVQPGVSNTKAPGHVGLYAFHFDGTVWLLAGNQGDAVSVKPFPIDRVLAVQRLAHE